MDDASKVRSYFTRSAVPFDSLYGEEEMNPFWRWVNRRFRRDIYERYLLAVDHARAIGATSALDVGCGSGRYAVGLAEAGVRRIVGVDFSPSMIELAERNTDELPGVGVNVDFTCADFMAWETDERFDLVIAMGFFDYMADPVTVLRKMRGHATRSVLASFPSVSVYRTPIRKVRYRIKRVPVHFYEPGQIDGYARAAGFSGLEIHKVPGAGQDNVAAFSV
jgi:SAM-dependent methyltransferase